MENGKYFIFNEQVGTDLAPKSDQQIESLSSPNMLPAATVPSPFVEASVLSSANRLVEELKAAYAKILQEKEEQISQLKDEIGDLRMLVRILEEQGAKKSGNFDFGNLDL